MARKGAQNPRRRRFEDTMSLICADPMPGWARECLWCMFLHGPTEDGDVPSKEGRSWLVRKGYADRWNGWNWLSHSGTTLAIEIGMDREKERWQRQRRQRET